jgi:hypothetical protein
MSEFFFGIGFELRNTSRALVLSEVLHSKNMKEIK